MWPSDVAKAAQDAIRAARERKHPEWRIRLDAAGNPLPGMVRAYVAESFLVRSLDGVDFEFHWGRWFAVRFEIAGPAVLLEKLRDAAEGRAFAAWLEGGSSK